MEGIQESIIKELGLEGLAPETQKSVLAKITEVVLKRITVNVLEVLSKEDTAEFEKMQETASPEEIDTFLKAKVGNYEQLVGEAVADFKEEMKEMVESLKDSVK